MIFSKAAGVVNVLKVEFTLRSSQRSSSGTLRIISDKSSRGSFVMPVDMTLNAGRWIDVKSSDVSLIPEYNLGGLHTSSRLLPPAFPGLLIRPFSKTTNI